MSFGLMCVCDQYIGLIDMACSSSQEFTVSIFIMQTCVK